MQEFQGNNNEDSFPRPDKKGEFMVRSYVGAFPVENVHEQLAMEKYWKTSAQGGMFFLVGNAWMFDWHSKKSGLVNIHPQQMLSMWEE